MAKAPDRGSFPLDHFHECDQQAKKYSQCVVKHQLMPKRCRDHQMQYLQCRMKSGLMEEEEMHSLGFLQANSWETQEAERKHIFANINRLKKDAWQNAVNSAKTPTQPPQQSQQLPK